MCYATYTPSVTWVEVSGVKIARPAVGESGGAVASFRQELEKRGPHGIPSLDDVESGKLVGAVLPMSEKAQIQMRNSIEVIDYLLNQERVVWS
jgi:hypothetical protein